MLQGLPDNFVNDYIWYHSFTIAAVLVIILLIAVHRRGSDKNLRLAKDYRDVLDPILSKAFQQYDGQLVVESPNVIKLYASGRESCLFAIVAFGLVPRQQIISFLFNDLFIGLKDELVMEVPILSSHPVSVTMAIVPKKEVKRLTRKKYPDIKQLCKEYRPGVNSSQNVPQSHSILLQKVEHVKYLLHSEEDIQIWKEHARNVRMVYMSDVNRFSRYPMTVRMVVQLGSSTVPMVRWLLSYVDRMAKARMTSGERREARKRRQGLDFRVQS